MSYSTANPPKCLGSGPGQKAWLYLSADAITSVAGAGYFENGDALGMEVGDVVFAFDSNTGDGGVHFVTAVTAGGAASASEYQAVTT